MNRHHTKLKGDLGLISVIRSLTQKGFFVSVPFSENAPFDLIAGGDVDDYRVQVKSRFTRNGTVEIHYRTTWADRHGSHVSHYSEQDFDVLAIYATEQDRCLYLLNDGDVSAVIRFDPPKNHQKCGVRMWTDYLSFSPSETTRDAPKDEPCV